MTYRYKDRNNKNTRTVETQTLHSMTYFSLHIRSSVSVKF